MMVHQSTILLLMLKNMFDLHFNVIMEVERVLQVGDKNGNSQ